MKLETIIKKTGMKVVCYCYYDTKKVYRYKVSDLTKEQLSEKYYSNEWWVEDNDLCVLRG